MKNIKQPKQQKQHSLNNKIEKLRRYISIFEFIIYYIYINIKHI